MGVKESIWNGLGRDECVYRWSQSQERHGIEVRSKGVLAMPPTSLIDSLQAVRRKVRTLAIASGVGIAIAAAIGLLVAIVFVDWSLGLEKVPRMLVIAGAIVGLLYVLWHWLAVPMMAKLNIGDVAGRLEHPFPQFDDRLRSTVNFVQGEIPGSRSMQERVASETDALAQTLNLNRVIVRRPSLSMPCAAAFAAIARCAGRAARLGREITAAG